MLHRLYAAYGFNVLKDLVFDGMHDVPLNVIKHHLEVQLELGLLNKATIEERLEAMPCQRTVVTSPGMGLYLDYNEYQMAIGGGLSWILPISLCAHSTTILLSTLFVTKRGSDHR